MELIRPKEDIELIESFRRGDTKALDSFYLAHREEFFKWAEKIYGLPIEKAADVYQEAILVLYKNLVANKLDQNGARLKTFLFGIGRNVALKQIAKWQKEEKASKEIGKDWQTEAPPELNERQQLAMSLYEKLQEPCKSILRMYYYDKLSLREIAEGLDYKSEDVAKNQKSRCLKTLRDSLLALYKK